VLEDANSRLEEKEVLAVILQEDQQVPKAVA
jgi:hypothetical protein